MKSLSILFYVLLCMPFLSCAQNTSYQNVEYRAETRGSFKHISIKGTTAQFKTLEQVKSITLSETSLKRLNSLLSTVSLDSIATLKAPSEKRFTDGALSATLSIVVNGTSYTSSSFDDGNPPEAIKELVTFLLELFKT